MPAGASYLNGITQSTHPLDTTRRNKIVGKSSRLLIIFDPFLLFQEFLLFFSAGLKVSLDWSLRIADPINNRGGARRERGGRCSIVYCIIALHQSLSSPSYHPTLIYLIQRGVYPDFKRFKIGETRKSGMRGSLWRGRSMQIRHEISLIVVCRMAEPGNRSLLRLFGIGTAENRNTLDFYRRRQ